MQKRPDTYYIPSNYAEEHRFKGVAYRNIAEAVVVAFLLFQLIELTPFIRIIRVVAEIIICGGVGIFFLVGIKGESVIQFLISFITFRKSRRKLHLRRTGYVNKKQREKDEKAEKSITGKLEKKAKELYKETKSFTNAEETNKQ